MALPKWSKDELKDYDERGYWIIPCESEDEALSVKDICKKYGRCAQAGRTFNKEGKEINFVLTKDKGTKKGEKPTPLVELAKKGD